MYGYHHSIINTSKIIGFIMLVIGVLAALKLFNIIDQESVLSSESVGVVLCIVCILAGILLMARRQRGY